MIDWDYEQAERDMLFSFAKDGDVLYDVGANEGLYSLDFAGRFLNGKAVAFDPIPETLKLLKKNVATSQVTIYPFGLSSYNGTATFYVSPVDLGATSLAPLEQDRFGDVKEVIADVHTIDTIIDHKAYPPNLIKIDVEGAELYVLTGAEQTLSNYRPIIQVEMLRKWTARFNYHPNDIIEYMSKLRYKCFVLRGGSLQEFPLMRDDTTETNFYFLPEKML